MTQSEITAFLKEGALLRLKSKPADDSEPQVLLWKGPFKRLESTNSLDFSVTYQDFFGSQVAFLKAAAEPEKISVKELRKLLQSYLQENPTNGDEFSRKDFVEPQMAQFQDSFQSIQGKIHRGEIEKAVPVVFAHSHKLPSLADKARMLDHCLEAFHELYPFGFWQDGFGILGATPEILFHQNAQTISSMALAGTCPKADVETRVSLLKDPKELQEHQLVVKDIQERLSKWGWVKTGTTEIVEFPVLLHLRTSLEVQASNVSALDLLKSLHPTPALGVYPRNYGIQWLKELPYQAERNLFGAPVTFRLGKDEVLSLVAIRNLHWHSGKSFVGSGCGLVATSDLHREWSELGTKRESVFKVLGL